MTMISKTLFFNLKEEWRGWLWFFLAFVLLGILAYFEKGLEAAIHVPIALIMLVVLVIVICDLFILIIKREKLEMSWIFLVGISIFYATTMFLIGKSKIAVFIFFLSLLVSIGLSVVNWLKR